MLLEIAKQFVAHGAKAVVLMARNKDKLEEVTKQVGPQCHWEQGDVSKIESCRAAVQSVVDKFGQVDVLVNGAAGNFLATAEKISTNGVKRVLDIDTVGTFNMSQCVFKQSMKARKSGVIINISASLHWNGSWA